MSDKRLGSLIAMVTSPFASGFLKGESETYNITAQIILISRNDGTFPSSQGAVIKFTKGAVKLLRSLQFRRLTPIAHSSRLSSVVALTQLGVAISKWWLRRHRAVCPSIFLEDGRREHPPLCDALGTKEVAKNEIVWVFSPTNTYFVRSQNRGP